MRKVNTTGMALIVGWSISVLGLVWILARGDGSLSGLVVGIGIISLVFYAYLREHGTDTVE